MANNVFANGREVSCKKADGKAICAFPDVCMTPPENPATPPGVPIPYPNTGMAKDTTSGSKKVKISGQEVLLKNKSHFKKSMGDEAGSAAKKGVITSVNRGKVFFKAWSMDVKVEKQNVVRHLDLTTHNHASDPGQTPPWAYVDTMGMQVNNEKDPCKEMRQEVKEKCEKHVSANTYEGGKRDGEINRAGLKRDMCNDSECNQAMKCVLVPYDHGCCTSKNSNAKKDKTPHHVIPAHCFMPPGEREAGGPDRYEGCENYDPDKAPCVCVYGKDKSEKRKQHARIHTLFDEVEDSNKTNGAGTWSYNKAADAGAESVSDVTGCDENCTKAQLNKYHNKDAEIPKGTELRADSSGKSTPPPSLNIVTPSGAHG
jgi:hypothetical protein